MSKFLNITAGLLIIFLQSCNSNPANNAKSNVTKNIVIVADTNHITPDADSSKLSKINTSHLQDWSIGAIVTPEEVKVFGEENTFVSTEITDSLFKRIYGKSFKEDCTIPREDLRYLKLLHYDIDEKIRIGELICNKAVESDLLSIFKELYKAKYPIEKLILIDEFDADDTASMEANNSSGFNYRTVAGTNRLSKHALGTAVDINPLYNPYVKTKKNGELYVSPENAAPYVDRSKTFNYKIDSTDLCCKLFKKHGFEWGGDWGDEKDYQHFQKDLE